MKSKVAWPALDYTTEQASGGSVSNRHRRRYPPVGSRTPAPECASCASTSCCASPLVAAGPPALSTHFLVPSFAWAFGCCQPPAWCSIRWAQACRQNAYARPTGRLSLPCPCRPGAALHLAPLRPPRCRVWPLPRVRVSGKRSQTLKTLRRNNKWQTTDPQQPYGSAL